MATVVAIAYPGEGTAEQARGTVFRLEDELVLGVEQVAVISRDVDERFHVHTSHEGFPMAGGAIWGGQAQQHGPLMRPSTNARLDV